MRLCAILLAACVCVGCPFLEHQCNAPAALDAGPLSPPLDCSTSWTTVAQPFFQNNCSQCHDWEQSDFPASGSEIREVVLGCGMPPGNHAQPSVQELQQLIAWLDCGACGNTAASCSSDAECGAGACSCGACCTPAKAARAPDAGGAAACCSPLECQPSDGGFRCCSTSTCSADGDCCSGACESAQCVCLQVGEACFDGTDCCSGLCSVFGAADGGTCAG